MKKAKNLFDFGLFVEGLRQTRGLALTFIFIVNLISVLLPAGIAVIYEDSGVDIVKLTLDNVPNFLHLYLIFMVLAPILTYKLFYFLNKRNACDYYHSIPQTRLAIFTSNILAILFWIVLSIIITASVTLITYAIFSQYFDVSLVAIISLLKFCVSIFICSALITAGVALGCVLSGRIILSVLLSAIFLIGPRLLIVLFTFTVTVISPLLAIKPSIFILEYNANLLFASVFSAEESFISLLPMIYTAIVAIIYFVIAAIYFIKRKSELAGRLMHSQLMHRVSVLLISLPATFVAYFILLYMITTLGSLFVTDMLTAILYTYVMLITVIVQVEVFGLITLILYTLLTGGRIHKFRQFLKPIASYFVAQVVIFLLILGVYYGETLYTTNSKNINYIILPEYSVGEEIYNYQMETYKIRDKDLNILVSNALKRTVSKSIFSGSNTDYDYGNYTDVTVGINNGFITRYREIKLTNSEYELYMSYINSSEDFHKMIKTLPKYNTETMNLSDPNNLSEDELYKLYKMLDEELDYVDSNEWLTKIDEYVSNNYIKVEIDAPWGSNSTRLPITTLTPETYDTYMEMIGKK